MCFGVGVEGAPEAVDLVFDVFGVGYEGFGVVAEGVAFGGVVFFVLAVVVGDLDEPDAGVVFSLKLAREGECGLTLSSRTHPDASRAAAWSAQSECYSHHFQ